MQKNLQKKIRNAQRHAVAPPARLRIQNILATTDLSNGSLAGVRHAVALAQKVGASAALLHVVEFPPPPPMPGMRTVTLTLQDSKIDKHARARLKTLTKRESKGDVNLTPVLRSGNSVYGIMTTAREHAADLIVIATHGYTGAKRVLAGQHCRKGGASCSLFGAHRSGSHTSKALGQNASIRTKENPRPD